MSARKIFALLGIALVTLSVPALAQKKAEKIEKQEAKVGLEIGDAAPMTDVEMTGVDGKATTIADAAGKKGTMVVFTCNSCPWVKAWDKRMVALGNKYLKKDIGVIAINANDPAVREIDGFEGNKQRAKARRMKYAYVVDQTSDVARAFGATRTPEVFLFDAEGKLVYHGAIDDDARHEKDVEERYLRNALTAVAAGKKVELAETKALGCTIKWRKEEDPSKAS